jgi:hypothetical protein
MRRRLTMICTLLSVSAWAASPQLRALSLDDIRRVESLVKMPPGTKSIASYNRFYALTVEAGREVIWGVFLLRPTPPTVHIVAPDQMPDVQDGGCSVVNVRYDLREAKITAAFCNGLA